MNAKVAAAGAAGLLVGLVAGVALATLAPDDSPSLDDGAPPAPAGGEDALRERLAAAEAELARLRLGRVDSASPEADASPSPAGGDASDPHPPRPAVGGLPPEAAEEARRRGEQRRQQLLRQAEEAHRKASEEVRQELEDAQAVKTALAQGDGLTVLNMIAKLGKPMPEVVADANQFEGLFQRSVAGPALNGDDPQARKQIADGATLSFPAGVHAWSDSRTLGVFGEFPKDLLIVGAGMDQTLLRLNEISANSAVRSLTFRDMTIDCNNDYLTDLRAREPATIRVERCRIVGFDMGAGGSVMLAARRAAFYATDCRIEAGYSRARAGFGNLFRVRDGLLVRIERTAIVGPFSSIYDSDRKAAYRFVDCELIDAVDPRFRRPAENVVFERCTTTTTPEGPVKKRSFTDINPGW